MLVWLPIADLRPLAGCSVPPVGGRLVESVRRWGVLDPLLCRPAGPRGVIQEGRRGDRRGYFVIRPDLATGPTAYAGTPPFFATRAEALASLPADVPYEVVHGLRRLAAALACKVNTVPAVVLELTDAQAAAVRRAR